MLKLQRRIDDYDKSRIQPKSTYDLLNKEARGRKSVGFLAIDYKIFFFIFLVKGKFRIREKGKLGKISPQNTRLEAQRENTE